MSARAAVLATALVLSVLSAARVRTHDGPPFPIVHNQTVGQYHVSVWTDPDATDDGTPGGQFWVMMRLADGSPLPPDTRARVTIRPLDRPGDDQAGTAEPVKNDVARQFVAVLMDHEGRYRVETAITGPAGAVTVHAEVDATYDLRPAPVLLVVYALPFVAVGLFWLKIMRRRGGGARAPS